jgi:MEMO1 family protein
MKRMQAGIAGIMAAAGLACACFGGLKTNARPKVRPPAVAGTFYPADAKELSQMVDGFLAKVTSPALEDVVAIVSPHAGYVFSGPVAGSSYAAIKGRKFDRVVVIAPSHYEAFGFSSVFDGSAYATPLGEVPVDRAFAARLAGMSSLIKLSGQGHTPTAELKEHSIEVQLPFLQRSLEGPFQIVPIMMGSQSYEACRALGVALAKLVQGTNTLIVASSDLSHYHPYDEAVTLDHKTLNAILEWDYLSLSRNLERQVWEACGGGPVVATMIACERLGASHAKLLKYANSGDATNDKRRVVGYGAVAIVRNGAGALEKTFSLQPNEKETLLEIAHKSVEAAVINGRRYEPATELDALMRERGAFVTLTNRGELRGCIGYVAPMKPLSITVRDVAAMAATRDSRFNPVAPAELVQLDYEISVLSPLRRVLDVKEIRVGEHGLLIKKGDYEGLLLPQVATEQKWDRTTFLDQTCLKAGVPQGCWKEPDTDIFRFTALVFGKTKKSLTQAPNTLESSAALY